MSKINKIKVEGYIIIIPDSDMYDEKGEIFDTYEDALSRISGYPEDCMAQVIKIEYYKDA